MNPKCLIKCFALAFAVQGALFLLCAVIPGMGKLILSLYEPMMRLADVLTGAKGEATMIVTPILGLLGGFILYSLLGAIVLCFFSWVSSRSRAV